MAFFAPNGFGKGFFTAGGLGLSNPHLLFIGDSITFGTGITGDANKYPQKVIAATGITGEIEATPGDKFSDAETACTTTPALLAQPLDTISNTNGKNNILVVFLGTNDLFNSPAANEATTYGRLRTFIQNRVSLGTYARIIFVNTIARNNTSDPAGDPARNLKIHTFNNLVRAGIANGELISDGITHFVDMAAVREFVPWEDRPANTTYYGVDEIHPTATGATSLANAVSPAVEAIVNGTAWNNTPFTPMQVPGLVFWGDANDASNSIVSGRYDQLTDLSGYGNHFVAPASNRRPYQFTGSNSQLAMDLQVTGVESHWLTNATVMPTSADYTKLVVSSLDATVSGVRNIFSGSAGTSHALYYSSSNFVKLWHNADFVTSSTASVVGTAQVIIATYVESTKAGAIYINGSSVGTGTAANSNTNAAISIGTLNDATGLAYDGDIYDVLLFSSAIASYDITALSTFYQTKVGLL